MVSKHKGMRIVTRMHKDTIARVTCALFVFMLMSCAVVLNGCVLFGGKGKTEPDVGEVEDKPIDEKMAELQAQLDRKFEDPDAHFALGQLYHSGGRWTKAQYHYNIALSFDPVHSAARVAMVQLLLDSGDTAGANATAKTYKGQASVSPKASLELAKGFHEAQLDQYALPCYEQALELDPNSPQTNREVGYYYLSKGNDDLARRYLTRSFELDPRQPDVAGQLGRLGVEVRIPEKKKKSLWERLFK